MNTPLSWWRERPKPEPREKAKWTDIAIVVLTLAIVYLAYETGGQTDQLIKAANIQAGAATKNSQAAADFASYANGINVQTSKAVDEFRRLADESKESIKATQAVMRQDQRAWVGLAEPKIDDFSEDKYPRISFRFVNSGKTPAIQVKTLIDWMPSNTRGPVCGESGRSRQFYEGPSIPPQGQYVLRDPSHNPWYLENSTDQHQHWDPAGPATFFCFFGEISYKDIFTSAEHTTHFCIYGDDPKKPNDFLYCPKNNDMN